MAQHSVPGMLHIVDDSDTKIGGLTIDSGKALFNAMYTVDLIPSSDQITISNASHLEFGNGSADTAFSISAWIKMDDATSFDIMQKHHEWRFGTDGSNKLYRWYTYFFY